MKTRSQIIDELKSIYPILQKGDDFAGYVKLNENEYNATIDFWADNEIARLINEAQTQSNLQAKSALLEKLGINEDEAKLLLS